MFEDEQAHLGDVVTLLHQGNSDLAKMRLVAFLRANPLDPSALQLSAMILITEHQYDAAATALREVLRQQPRRADAGALLGVTNLFRNKPDLAEGQLRNTLKLDPDNTLALRYLAWIEQQHGNLHAAAALLERLAPNPQKRHPIELDHALARLYLRLDAYEPTVRALQPLDLRIAAEHPLDIQLALQLALAHVEIGNTPAATALLDRIAAVVPSTNPDLRYLRAETKRLDADYAAATRAFEALITDNPAYANRARLALARTLAASGNTDAAITSLQAIVEHSDGDALVGALRQLTALLTTSGRYDQALEQLSTQRNRHPSLPMIAYLMVETYILQGDGASALDAAKKLVKQHPDFLPGYLIAGRLATATGKLRRAEAMLRQATRMAPQQPATWIELTKLYVSVDAMEKAQTTLRAAVTHNPDNPDLRFELGTLLEQLGDIDAANVQYRHALVADMYHRGALHNLLSNLARDPARHDEAIRIGQYAKQQMPGDAVILDSYGWVLVNAGRVDEGITLIEQAAKIYGDDDPGRSQDTHGVALTYYHLGSSYHKAGNTAKARRSFQKALDLAIGEPASTDIKAYLAQ